MEQIAPALGEFLGTILTLAIVTFLGYIAPIVKSWLQAVAAELKGRLGVDRFELLRQVAFTAVRYAEQAGLNGAIENTARAKLRLALERAQLLLGEAGVTNISVNSIETAIEEAYRIIFVEDPVLAEAYTFEDLDVE